jgi:predicted transposase YdaD
VPDDWDRSLKLLAKYVPQDFVSWLVEGAIYEEEVSPHLNARNIHADILYRIRVNNQPCLLHIEFQLRSPTNMAERMWEYNVLATLQNHLVVYSFVVYLKKVNSVAVSPYILQGLKGENIHLFYYNVIKLWEVSTQQLKDLGLKGLLPLLPLTHEGKKQAVVEEVITELCKDDRQERSELLSLAYGLASLIFRSGDEQRWLKWRFGMLDDLLDESWAFQEILQKGLKRGLDQGLEQGLKQGLEQGIKQGIKQGVEQGVEQGAEKALQEDLLLSRHTFLALVEHYYPALVSLARAKIDGITEQAVLQNLILQISFASNESEARAHLI